MSQLRKRLLIGLVSGASLVAAPNAAVAIPPVGECPGPKWELRAAPTDVSGQPSVDVNRNGLSCYMEAPEGGGIFTIIDDVARSPRP
jgi:hypothetical protein